MPIVGDCCSVHRLCSRIFDVESAKPGSFLRSDFMLAFFVARSDLSDLSDETLNFLCDRFEEILEDA